MVTVVVRIESGKPRVGDCRRRKRRKSFKTIIGQSNHRISVFPVQSTVWLLPGPLFWASWLLLRSWSGTRGESQAVRPGRTRNRATQTRKTPCLSRPLRWARAYYLGELEPLSNGAWLLWQVAGLSRRLYNSRPCQHDLGVDLHAPGFAGDYLRYWLGTLSYN